MLINDLNLIFYKSQKYYIPPSHIGTRVEVIEYEDKLEISYRKQLLNVNPYNMPIKLEPKKQKT